VRRALLPVAAALVLLSACTASATTGSDEPETPSPFAECTELTDPTVTNDDVPDLSLPCFTGGQSVSLRNIKAPAVINVWASWCAPCREELPIMQGLADRTQGKLLILGVATRDRREGTASFGVDHDVRMPTLYDPDQAFSTAIKAPLLPATVFVDPVGKVYIHRDAMNVDELIEQVKEHTGVTVTR
jgi:cytochrome c biogenesis protein CcmG/thiol:disulfide interchange protein DsbE